MKIPTLTVTDVFAVADTSASAQPLYSSKTAAGFPVPGDDLVDDELNVHDLLVKHPESTYFVRVDGASMEGAGIFSGDVLVVDRSVDAVHGSIVVAAVGGGMVVKRLQKDTGRLFLVSENPDYTPIEVNEANECYLWGVVTGSVRQF